jgi:hypothetical protein
MAKLTANPQTVGLPGPNVTRIDWDTEGNFDGKVEVSVNGGPSTLVVSGGRSGGFTYPSITLGSRYVFTLRRSSNNAFLAAVTVTTIDLTQLAIDQAIAAATLQNRFNPPQWISGLVIAAGIDDAVIRFRTVHPTIPLIEIFNEDGDKVASAFGLFGGPRRNHSARVGNVAPLAQGTRHRVRITVPGRKPLYGPAKDVVRTAEFRTGTRAIDVLFDSIKVLRDGDPGAKGAGEFWFGFDAGDADDRIARTTDPFACDICESEPDIAIDRSIPLPEGPRRVWVTVQGRERDDDLEFGLNTSLFISGSMTGSQEIHDDEYEGAAVGEIFDVSGFGPGFHTLPFHLETGQFGVWFNVKGRIAVIVHSGEGVADAPLRLDFGSLRRKQIALTGPGSKGRMGGEGGAGLLLGLDADERVWQRTVDPERPGPKTEGWSLLAPTAGGPVTGLRLDDGRVELVAVAGDGQALHWMPGEDGRDGFWRALGGRFAGPLVAVEDPPGRATLLGVGADGRAMRRTLGGERGEEWIDLGGELAGNLLAVEAGAGRFSLLAVDRDGRIVHRLFERDRPEASAWRPIGGPRTDWLAVLPAEAGGIVVTALTEELVLHRLLWRDHPEGEAERRWEELGPLETLIRREPVYAPGERDSGGGDETTAG